MKRKLSILFTIAAMLICLPMQSANADHGGGRGHGHGRGVSRGHGHSVSRGIGHGHGHGLGFGMGGFYDDDSDYAELYRELYNNLPYFALHPPVYYSYPVPRTYGYSPFAYPPHVMTPDVEAKTTAVQIINPYVSQEKPAEDETDREASTAPQTQPLVIVNPFVGPARSVAQQ